MQDIQEGDLVIVKSVLYPAEMGVAVGRQGRVVSAVEGRITVHVGDQTVVALDVEPVKKVVPLTDTPVEFEKPEPAAEPAEAAAPDWQEPAVIEPEGKAKAKAKR